MTNEKMTNGLLQLGFYTGWVLNGDEITLWENQEPQPTLKEISDASKLWDKTEQAKAEAKATAKAAILDRIGLTADELKTILG